LVDAKDSEYSRYNGEMLLTPNRSEAFLAAGYLRSAGPRSRMLAAVMDSLAIDVL
jgi:bifunctional ADP-heptose synthase (sugar kinase/adenylyltransferase)